MASWTVAASSSSVGQTNLSHEAHVPYWRVNNPTLWDFCVSMIGTPALSETPKNPEHVHTVQPPTYALPPPPKHRKALNTERRSVAVQQMMASSHDLTVAASSSSFGQTNLSHEAHVPYWRVNNPTLWDFCVLMIGRADIQGSKSAHSPAPDLRPPTPSETPKNPEHVHTVQPPTYALPPLRSTEKP